MCVARLLTWRPFYFMFTKARVLQRRADQEDGRRHGQRGVLGGRLRVRGVG